MTLRERSIIAQVVGYLHSTSVLRHLNPADLTHDWLERQAATDEEMAERLEALLAADLGRPRSEDTACST